MKATLLTLVFGLLWATALPAQSDADFKKMVTHYWELWSSLNPDKCESMYVKDPDAVFFDVTPMRYKGWNAYAEGVKKAFGGMTSAKIVPNDDITVSRHGNFAFTTDTFHGVLTDKDGKTSNLDGRHTVIWEKMGGKWLIVHDHVSVPSA